MTNLSQVAAITALPAVSMALGSAAFTFGAPSETLQSTMQHFSAGLLIGAVVTDIFPILKDHLVNTAGQPDLNSCVAAAAGFVLALAVMYGIKSLDLEGEGEDDVLQNEQTGSTLSEPLLKLAEPDDAGKFQNWRNRIVSSTDVLLQLVSKPSVNREEVDEQVHSIEFLIHASLRVARGLDSIEGRAATRLQYHVAELKSDVDNFKEIQPTNLAAIYESLNRLRKTVEHIHEHAERSPFRRWATVAPKLKNEEDDKNAPPLPGLPWGLFTAVVVDSGVDGMLIGLAGSVSLDSGWLMAIATAIEMCFLGFSFAYAISGKTSKVVTVATLAVPPLAMLAASCTASVGTDSVENSSVFAGLIAFALVALLFLVLQELLLEAHEKEGGELWQVSVWLYVGLFLSLVLAILL